MASNSLLYEITHGEWLMDLRYLFQLRESLRLGFSENAKTEEKTSLISFFNEDHQRISPENVSEIPEGSIAVVNAVGPMLKYRSWYALGADEVIAQLDFANNLQNISAIILNVDGPGGAVSAIAPFVEFSKRKRKPVIAVCDTSLSLHYWIPNAVADHLMADNTISARFGSVGVVSRWMDFSKYQKEMGIEEHEVYAAESPHKNEIFRKIEEDEKAGKKMLQDMHLSPLAQKFQAAIKTSRPNLADAEGILTGRTFTAEDALKNGMIDSIGTMKEAMQVAQMLAEVGSLKNVTY